jgi:hypothetical protein
MRRGTAATTFGAAMVLAATLLGVTAGARLVRAGRGELAPPEQPEQPVQPVQPVVGGARQAADPTVAAQRVEELPRAVDEPERPTVERRLRIVRAVDQAPMAGASITLRDLPEGWQKGLPPRRPVERRADANGELRLALDRSVDAIVQVPGFYVEAEELKFDAAAPLAERTIELHPAAALSGRVVDAGGAPVAGAKVMALGRFARECDWVARGFCGNGWRAWNNDLGTTDAEGRFGPVACYAGPATAFQVTHAERSVWLAGLALDAARGPAFHVDLRLPPRVDLVVRAVRPDGRPAHGDSLCVQVTRLFDLFGGFQSWSLLDEEGCVTVGFDAPGPHRIEVGSRGFDDPLQPMERETVDLHLSVGTTEIEVVVPWPEGWVEGSDRDDEAEDDEGDESEHDDGSDDEPPPASASIRGTAGCDCAPDETCDSLRVVVRRDGVEIDCCDWWDEEGYEFDDLAPGGYVVAVEGAGHRRVEAGVTLEPGGSVVLPRLVVPAFGQLHGRLVDPRGRPLDGIEVTLVGARDPEDERCDGTTDEAGRFRMARIDGACFLDVLDEKLGNFRVAVPDELPDDWVITLPAPRRITGVVVAPFGVPLDWIEVGWWQQPDLARDAELLRAAGGVWRGDQALDRDGRFTIERAPAGECVLQLRLDAFLITIARRVVPAGGDVDLGVWELPAAR